MATWLKADGTVETVQPKADGVFTLAEMQGFVGGPIELVPCIVPGHLLWVDEEGKLKEKRANVKATRVMRYGGDVIVGDALLTAVREVK